MSRGIAGNDRDTILAVFTCGGFWTAVAVAGLVIVVLTEHYGGQMVYAHGVGTQQAQATSSASPDAPPAR